jgi:UDP:flavonoid glycosyltransferase YjiC (YdhE family)
MRRIMNIRWGTIRAIRDTLLPCLRESYDDIRAAVAGGADLLVTHPTMYATRLVAETTGVPWVSTQITPLGIYSAFDPPALPGAPELARRLRFLGPRFWGPLGRILKRATRSLARPIDSLRSELGLPRADENPLVDGHSPALVLALFSRQLADKQADWPPQTVLTGFPWYDQDGSAGLPPELSRFLDAGPPPIVFTLGVTAAMVAGSFFQHCVAAASMLDSRAVLIVGKDHDAHLPALPADVVAFPYAPFSELFPRASVIVHAGGIGTTGLAMRSGRPMLVVPYAHDQPDNAGRLVRLGVARALAGRRSTAARLAAELKRLRNDPAFSRRAAEVGARVRQEDGVRAACDALEAVLEQGACSALT